MARCGPLFIALILEYITLSVAIQNPVPIFVSEIGRSQNIWIQCCGGRPFFSHVCLRPHVLALRNSDEVQ